MRKGINDLVEANGRELKKGNHHMERTSNGREFYLYWTCICKTNDNEKTFSIDNSYGTITTTQATNGYREYFLNNSYNEVGEI